MDVTYTDFRRDPLVPGHLAPMRALWDRGGDWVIADFLCPKNSAYLLARKAVAYGAQLNVVHDRGPILTYCIIETLSVRPVALAIFEWAGERRRYRLLRSYDRDRVPPRGRKLHLPTDSVDDGNGEPSK